MWPLRIVALSLFVHSALSNGGYVVAPSSSSSLSSPSSSVETSVTSSLSSQPAPALPDDYNALPSAAIESFSETPSTVSDSSNSIETVAAPAAAPCGDTTSAAIAPTTVAEIPASTGGLYATPTQRLRVMAARRLAAVRIAAARRRVAVVRRAVMARKAVVARRAAVMAAAAKRRVVVARRVAARPNPPDVSNGDQCFLLRSNSLWYPQHCLRFTDYALCEEISTVATCGDYQEVDGICLQVKMDPLSFNDAEKDCRHDGGNLVSIHDSTMNSNVYDEMHLGGVTTVGWIGLQQIANVLSWTDGTKVDYNNLPTPKNADGCFTMSMVAFLYPKQWISEDCSITFPYVCQREKSVNPVTKAPPTTTISPSVCGQNEFRGASGIINSPGYPSYFHDDDCYYQINGTLNAINIDVSKISGPTYWRLDIYAGSYAYQNMRIYSISSLDPSRPLQYSSPIPYMYIHFQADPENYGTPFQMTWTTTINPQYSLGDLTGSTILPPQSIPTTHPLCDDVWIYDDVRNICLGFTQALKWDTSRALCEQQNAQLLSIHDFAEEQNLIGLLDNLYHPGGYQLWIGGNWMAGYWRWTDNSNFQYQDFVNGDTSNANGNCLTIEYYYAAKTKGWRAADCTLDLQAICFKPPKQQKA
ncbi:unnamed protein product, partial [Mesorhabditis belari]|uniref:C-type lectin n=1 Tax=Mesorhabditis belari TaxID=2138241 RepID=A0AAF3J5B8_9BILA